MDKLIIFPSKLKGTLAPPPSKSHTLRALIFALMAKGKTTITNYLPSPDTSAMIEAICQFGAKVITEKDTLTIFGTNGHLKDPKKTIDCKNSGQVLRFLGALSSLTPYSVSFTGDRSIQTNRPILPLIHALHLLGVKAFQKPDIPLTLKGPLTLQKTSLSGEDSQPVSALLITGAFAPHPIEIHVENPGELPWIDLTLHWLNRFQIPYQNTTYQHYKLEGGAQINGFDYKVPADFSSAAYPIAAALVTQSEITLSSLDMSDVQGDKKFLFLLQKLGAKLEITNSSLTVKKSLPLKGGKIDVNPFIDALPILATLACFSQEPTHLYNAAIARKKESDRISTISQELKKMGAKIEEKSDGLIIHPSPLNGAELVSHEDHRIALSLMVAALRATTPSTLLGAKAIFKSYSSFPKDLQKLGAHLME